MKLKQEGALENLKKYGPSDRLFCKQLHDLLAMKALVEGDKLHVPKLYINRSDPEKWGLLTGKEESSASSLVGKTEKIHLSNIKKQLIYNGILPGTAENIFDTLTQEDQKKYEELFDRFIKEFLISSSGISKAEEGENIDKEQMAKKRFYSPDFLKEFIKEFDNFFSERNHTHDEKLKDEIRLIRDSHLVLVHMLYKKDPSYLSEDGEITEEGIQFIADAFNATKKYMGGHISKIFHDGDYWFLFEDDGRGNVKPYLLEHYAQAIKYLMDSDSKNTLYMNDEEGRSTWKRKKKNFINSLFVIGQGDLEKIKVEEKLELSLHERFADVWNSTIRKIQERFPDIPIESSHRAKTQQSKQKKNLGRPTKITDESGVRLSFFGNPSSQDILSLTSQTLQEYLSNIQSLSEFSPDLHIEIKSIQLDKKGDLISDEEFEHKKAGNNNCTCLSCSLKKIFPNSRIRKKHKKKEINNALYKDIIDLENNPILEYCTSICFGNVTRGGNGGYKDIKGILELEIGGKPFYQEISFRNHTNGFGLDSPRVLTMEKDIFERAKNRHDEDKGMSVSFGSVIKFIEKGIKGMAADADIAEKKLKDMGIMPQTPSYFQEISIEGKSYSLKGLLERNERNAKRIDEIICAITNYFIKQNKLIHFNINKNRKYSGLVTPDLIYDSQFRSQMRFLTSDTIKYMAEEPLFTDASISIYHKPKNTTSSIKEGFLRDQQLGEIGDTLFMLEQAKLSRNS